MASKETSETKGYVVDVKIVDVEKRKNEGPKYYAYVLKVTWANPSNLFIIYRRYAQFFDLQCKLLDLFGHTLPESGESNQTRQIPFLPGKIILGRSQIRQIALERKGVLDEYCQSLIALPEHISRSHPILDFFHPSATDVRQSVEHVTQENKLADKSSLVISEPAQLPSYRCLADFTATEKIEMSLKRNAIVQVLQKHPNGWWFVQSGDQTGFVPGTYLQPSELKHGSREGKTIEKSLNETYVVNHTYKAAGKDELSLEQGSFVTVMEKSLTGWWKIKFNNQTGQFPALYLSSCDGRHTPADLLDDVSNRSSKKKELSKARESDDDEEDDYHLDPSKATEPELYYAHTDFSDNVGDCLSFRRGDIIEVHEKHPSGWWFGRRMKGEPILSWVPAKCLQKEPVKDSSVKNNNTLPFNSKLPTKPVEKVSQPPVNAELKEEKPKISTNAIRKNFENQPSATHVDQSKIIKKPQSVETKTPTMFRPVNDKKETTTAPPPLPKNPPVTSSPLFRPVGVKQHTVTTTPKSSSVSTPNAFRPVGGKQEASTTPKNSSVAASSAFRPVNNKPESTSASKTFPNTNTASPFRPEGVQKTFPTSNPSTFRPINDKQEATNSQKKPPLTTSTPLRSANDKPDSTQKSVKDLLSKYDHK